MDILAVNTGSSSIKFSLFRVSEEFRVLCSGALDGIGSSRGQLHAEDGEGTVMVNERNDALDHGSACMAVLSWIASRLPAPDAVGHRIVHGGPQYASPVLLTEQVTGELQQLKPFAPQHLPQALNAINRVSEIFPQSIQVACFDTAFHRAMPPEARFYPLPDIVRDHGIERYGFHGLSYQYLLGELERVAGPDAADGRVVLAHLGHGASMAAVCRGRSVDTTMGFSPAGGLMMSTRSGDLDPGVLLFLLEQEHLDAAELKTLVNRESGLLGVSGTSGDMRTLVDIAPQDDRARRAVEMFCYRARKAIGSYAAALGGIDTLVFSGGIGEHSSFIRSSVCNGLAFLGIELDQDRNIRNLPCISRDTGRVDVRVIPTDEELMIARLTRETVAPV